MFGQLVLGDEINWAPAKTQAALLEAMQERQVTVDGTTHQLRRPFMVVATQNPIEHEGTYALPEAQLDRFLLRTRVGYPGPDDETDLLMRRAARGTDEVALVPVCDADGVLALQAAVERVHVDPAVARYVVDVVTAGRIPKSAGASLRGSLALLKRRARALSAAATSSIPTTSRPSRPSLAHRLVLRSEVWVRGIAPESIVERVVGSVPAPSWR